MLFSYVAHLYYIQNAAKKKLTDNKLVRQTAAKHF